MDKSRLEYTSVVLLIELKIGLSFMDKKERTSEDIKRIDIFKNVPITIIDNILLKLVAHGILIPKVCTGNIKYVISNFGIYFFDKLKEQNEDVVHISEIMLEA